MPLQLVSCCPQADKHSVIAGLCVILEQVAVAWCYMVLHLLAKELLSLIIVFESGTHGRLHNLLMVPDLKVDTCFFYILCFLSISREMTVNKGRERWGMKCKK